MEINGACGLVQNKDWAIAQKSAGEGNALTFASREARASFPNLCVIGFRQIEDELVRSGCAGCGENLLVGCVWFAVSDVLSDAGAEQYGFLQNNCKLPAQIADPVLANVVAIEQHFS